MLPAPKEEDVVGPALGCYEKWSLVGAKEWIVGDDWFGELRLRGRGLMMLALRRPAGRKSVIATLFRADN